MIIYYYLIKLHIFINIKLKEQETKLYKYPAYTEGFILCYDTCTQINAQNNNNVNSNNNNDNNNFFVLHS